MSRAPKRASEVVWPLLCQASAPVFSLFKWEGSHCYLTGLLGSKREGEEVKLLVSGNEFHMVQTLYYLGVCGRDNHYKASCWDHWAAYENTEPGGMPDKLLGTTAREMQNQVLVSCSYEPAAWTWIKHRTSLSLSYPVYKMGKLEVFKKKIFF